MGNNDNNIICAGSLLGTLFIDKAIDEVNKANQNAIKGGLLEKRATSINPANNGDQCKNDDKSCFSYAHPATFNTDHMMLKIQLHWKLGTRHNEKAPTIFAKVPSRLYNMLVEASKSYTQCEQGACMYLIGFKDCSEAKAAEKQAKAEMVEAKQCAKKSGPERTKCSKDMADASFKELDEAFTE